MPVTIDGSNTPTAGGVIYGDGTEYAATSAGTSGQLLQSNGSSAPSWVAAPSTSPAGSTGQVQYNNAGAFGAISSGTSGQVLTSGGSGAAPTWATPSAGALVLLSTQTVSSAVTYVTFSNVFNSTYNDYLIIFEAVSHNNSYPYTEGILQMQVEKAGSFRTSGYNGLYGSVWSSSISSSTTGGTITASGRQDSNSVAGTLYCLGMNQTTYLKQKFLGYTNSVGSVRASWFEQQQNDGAVTGVRFLVEDTNTTIVQGSFYIYGIAKS